MLNLRILLILALSYTAGWADDKPIPVSIYSRVAPSYERELASDGSYKREYYAIGYGGRVDGTVWDQTQEKEDFPEIAGIIAEELAKQNYHFSPDKDTADLLIIIHWGTTSPFDRGNLNDSINVAGDAFRALNDAQGVQIEVDSSSAEAAEQTVSLVSEQQLEIQRANAALDSALTMLQTERADQTKKPTRFSATPTNWHVTTTLLGLPGTTGLTP